MSKTKFTPGPWAAEGPDDFNIIPEGEAMALAAVVANGFGHYPSQHNAALIAAAPDMYEALELLKNHASLYMTIAGNVEDLVNSALAKARGES